MKSLVIASYRQPVKGSSLRVGIVEEIRDTYKHPVRWSKYRLFDREFDRSRTLLGVRTLAGFRKLYGERTNWKIEIPFVGSLVSPLFSLFGR